MCMGAHSRYACAVNFGCANLLKMLLSWPLLYIKHMRAHIQSPADDNLPSDDVGETVAQKPAQNIYWGILQVTSGIWANYQQSLLHGLPGHVFGCTYCRISRDIPRRGSGTYHPQIPTSGDGLYVMTHDTTYVDTFPCHLCAAQRRSATVDGGQGEFPDWST